MGEKSFPSSYSWLFISRIEAEKESFRWFSAPFYWHLLIA